jgi:hypothetical protein
MNTIARRRFLLIIALGAFLAMSAVVSLMQIRGPEGRDSFNRSGATFPSVLDIRRKYVDFIPSRFEVMPVYHDPDTNALIFRHDLRSNTWPEERRRLTIALEKLGWTVVGSTPEILEAKTRPQDRRKEEARICYNRRSGEIYYGFAPSGSDAWTKEWFWPRLHECCADNAGKRFAPP